MYCMHDNHTRSINPRSEVSYYDNLPNGGELDLGGTAAGDTGMALELSLLIFNSFGRDTSGLPIIIFILSLWLSLLMLTTLCIVV